MNKIVIIFIIFTAIILVSGCATIGTTEDEDELPVTFENLSELKEAINSIQPKNPDGVPEE